MINKLRNQPYAPKWEQEGWKKKLYLSGTYTACMTLLYVAVGHITESNIKTITKCTYFPAGANTFLHVGLRSAYSES
jgi:hypothetical protein